ncbi:hypothetical protein FN846DRAFT_348422 [Sphaerosporella brunnea]|uniref:DUF7079 domain-containing protein n=1 Tax=Sphaerosporella brunnea TaxID=1250544 RepID=A0A5J5EJI7_9PEZI|nr:hypothetical protein FN846DRAFT_348422 [Sphaerosporella brunnea]
MDPQQVPSNSESNGSGHPNPDTPVEAPQRFHPAVDSESTIISAEEQHACIMLSLLFLDTELTDWHLSAMARRLQGLNLDESALLSLLRYDVFPVLWGNLFAVAGEWAWFDSEWLLSEIEDRRNSWLLRRCVSAPAHALAWAVASWMVLGPFESLMERLRG